MLYHQVKHNHPVAVGKSSKLKHVTYKEFLAVAAHKALND
jgi:hypothetical protein